MTINNNTDRAALAARYDAANADFCQIHLDARDRDMTPEEIAEVNQLAAEMNELNQQLHALDTDAEGFNTPTVYLDDMALTSRSLPHPEELERVQIAFDATTSGEQTEADKRAALGWVKTATIELSRSEDSVTLSISVGDPRGAFSLTIRRHDDGSLVMAVPYPGAPALHRPLRRLQDGTYAIG